MTNAIFMDTFGYLWMLRQVHKEMSHEEHARVKEKSTSICWDPAN